MMWFSRIGVIVLPPLAYVITKRLCLSLQRADRDLVLHGRETGRLVRMPNGEFTEIHEPISPEKAWLLTSHEQLAPLELPELDGGGVRQTRVQSRTRFVIASHARWQLRCLKATAVRAHRNLKVITNN